MFLQVSVCPQGCRSQCMLGYTPLLGRPPCQGDPHARETPMPRRPPRRPPAKETACQGDPLPRRHPLPRRPPAKETPSRPIPRGEIDGDQILAHTQGGNWGGSNQGPHPRGKFRGIRSRPHIQVGNSGGSGLDPPTMTTAAGSMHPTGMHSCLLKEILKIWLRHSEP